MTIGRLLLWAVVALFALVPINWTRLWIAGEVPKDATIVGLAIGTLVCWSIAVALGYGLFLDGRAVRRRQQEEAAHLRDLMQQPLSEVKPTLALLKPKEKAYASTAATLKQVKTVGFSAGTRGVSVRVAKGVTLRSSGTRGHAIKDLVTVASGELVLTDQRILFAGDNKSFVIPLTALVNVTYYTNGFGFHDAKSTYTTETKSTKDALIFKIALEKVLRR